MFSFSPPSQRQVPVQAVSPSEPAWAGAANDVALGFECADPALQIAMWGQEAPESVEAVGPLS